MAPVVKNPSVNGGDIRGTGSIPGSGRFPGEGNGNPRQYSYLENPIDRGGWRTTVHGIAKIAHDQTNTLLLPQNVADPSPNTLLSD